MVVAYDGGPFHGSAPNDGVRTVIGDLTEAISTVVRRPVEATGAGRTDAGVHGWGQVISVDLPAATDLDGLVRSLNKLCAPSIAVRDPAWVADDFDARFSATWRQYRYDIWNGSSPNPLISARCWHVARPLSVTTMQDASDLLIGEHDFTSFCRRPKVDGGRPAPSMVRRVLSARWSEPTEFTTGSDRLLRFEIRATSFCHQMVRSIVGTLVDVGLGRFGPGDIRRILLAADRGAAGRIAPPQGLMLWEVGYPRS